MWDDRAVASPQTLSEADRRTVAVWAADCAERVLGLFEAEAPGDSRPREAIARLRAFARGELGVGEARRRFVAHAAARDVRTPAAVAAARAAAQAASIPHMGAHALGAAAYAAKAAALAAPDRRAALSDEIRRQLDDVSAPVRAALRQLPPVGENSSGPLGPGLLASGLLGAIIRASGGLDEPRAQPPSQLAARSGRQRETPSSVVESERAAHPTARLTAATRPPHGTSAAALWLPRSGRRADGQGDQQGDRPAAYSAESRGRTRPDAVGPQAGRAGETPAVSSRVRHPRAPDGSGTTANRGRPSGAVAPSGGEQGTVS